MDNNIFYVVAGSYTEFLGFILQKRQDPENKIKSYIFVDDPSRLRGISNIKGFYYGTFESRKDLEQIKTIIAASKVKKEPEPEEEPDTITKEIDVENWLDEQIKQHMADQKTVGTFFPQGVTNGTTGVTTAVELNDVRNDIILRIEQIERKLDALKLEFKNEQYAKTNKKESISGYDYWKSLNDDDA